MRPSTSGSQRATAYELEWRAEGRPLHFFCYERRSPGEAAPAGRYLPSPDRPR